MSEARVPLDPPAPVPFTCAPVACADRAGYPFYYCGDPDKTTRILGTVYLCGVPMHLEFIQVRAETDAQGLQQPVDPDPEVAATLEHFAAADGADGPWATIEIEGRNYVMFMTPHSQ